MMSSIEKVVLMISMFCCTTFAVYYTTGPQLDYPRLGKRNFYTEGTVFPVNEEDPILMSDTAIPVISNLNRRGIFTNTPKGIVGNGKRNVFVAKRGFFTRGSSDYPRIGKREGQKNKNGNRIMGLFTNSLPGMIREGRSVDFWSNGVNRAYQKVKEVKDDGEEEAEQGLAQGQFEAGDFARLQDSSFNVFFNEFDADNDGKLSKEEFSKGMQILKTQTLMC